MKNNNQEFPDEIIAMLLHQSWSTLTAAQKAQIEPYFSEQEYNVLHDAMQVKQVDELSEKSKLLQAFDAHHQTKSLLNTRGWRVAASILFLGIGALQIAILTQHKSSELVTQIIKDTVFIEQQTASKTIHTYDTVYLTSESRPQKTNQHKYPKMQVAKIENQKHNITPQPDVFVTPLNALSETPNTRRKNSIKADSAFQRLTFVTL